MRPHLHLGEIVVHVPLRIRALVRADELWLVALAALIGALAGLSVVVMNLIAQFMHQHLFALPAGAHLLGVSAIAHARALLVPSLGGAFNAPLTRAFYGFELIIGTYSIAMLAPVMAASVVAVLVDRGLGFARPPLNVVIPASMSRVDYVQVFGLGILCALIGILVMRGATLTESLFRKSGPPAWLRPAVGGLLVGDFGVVTPHVMSSGHAALPVVFSAPFTLSFLGLMIVMKALATPISIGSGFRGGLFFASLFLGAMVGQQFANPLSLVAPAAAITPTVGMVVGMSALAATIVAGPLTMAFLALSITGSLLLTAAVLLAAVIAALTTRRLFGYNFATWRFHPRGEVIRSAVDIGWRRNLTVGRMMNRELRTVRTEMAISTFRRGFPPGSTPRVVAVDERGSYAGIVLVGEAHAAPVEMWRISEILHYPETVLLPQMTVKEAVVTFEQAEADALAVIDDSGSRRVIGLLTEQYALRRYSDELEQRRRELSGEKAGHKCVTPAAASRGGDDLRGVVREQDRRACKTVGRVPGCRGLIGD